MCFLLDKSSGEYFQVQSLIVSSTIAQAKQDLLWATDLLAIFPCFFLQELLLAAEKGSETCGEMRDILQGKTSILSNYILQQISWTGQKNKEAHHQINGRF